MPNAALFLLRRARSIFFYLRGRWVLISNAFPLSSCASLKHKFALWGREAEEMADALGSEHSQLGVSVRSHVFSEKEGISKIWGKVGLASEKRNYSDFKSMVNLESTGDETLLAPLLAVFCCGSPRNGMNKLDISQPMDVHHATRVRLDQFDTFHGLAVEFKMEIPWQVPGASTSVFGVSVDSMQCTYDGKGNSIPAILLLLQERLYSQGGLKAEGIFRINPEIRQESSVRDELNKGNVPENIDVHCLASLIKALLRELPTGVLDTIPLEQLLQCHTQQQYLSLVNQLPPNRAALLDWVINLMADVAQEEDENKMNSQNLAVVFAPNMTQIAEPLTALLHNFQVMNLLEALVLRTMEDRKLDNNPVSMDVC